MWPFKSKDTKPAIKNEGQQITELEQLADIFNIAVNGDVVVTATTAMRVSAVYACVRLIAGNIASMPVKVYQKTETGREEATSHDTHNMLASQPSTMMSAYTFWETIVSEILLSGNGYAEIVRRTQVDPRIREIRYIPSTKVTPERLTDRIIYKINDEYGNRTIDQDDMLHFPGIQFDGCKAKSIIHGSQSVATAMQADTFTEKFYANGTHLGGYLTYPDSVTTETASFIRDQWLKKFQGADKAHLPAVLSEGGEYKPVTVNARDAHIIEARRYQVADIARIFGVPLFMINETEKSTSWGTGIEQQSMGYVRYTLQPHLNRIEQELNRKLYRQGRYFAEFYSNALLKADTKARNESYQIALGGNQQPGWMTINEVRKRENLPPIDGGDELYKPITGETSSNEEADEPDQE